MYKRYTFTFKVNVYRLYKIDYDSMRRNTENFRGNKIQILSIIINYNCCTSIN